MNLKAPGGQRVTFRRLTGRASSTAFVAVGVTVMGLLSGCAGKQEGVPTAEVKTVTAYGVTLDADAGPQAVAYVLLRSLKDDVMAAQAGKTDERKAAEQLTFSVVAPTAIEQRIMATLKQLRPNLTESTLGEERDKKLYDIVHYWAPIVGHYIASFDDSLEAAAARMWVTMDPARTTAHVYYPVSHDPAVTDPVKAETATLVIELGKEKAAGKEYWRVVRLSYLGRLLRKPTSVQIIEAHGLTLDGSASPEQATYVVVRSLAEAAKAKAAGNEDLIVSSLYRLVSLTTTSVTADSGEKGTNTLHGAPSAVAQWLVQIESVAARVDVDPAVAMPRMQVVSPTDASGKAVVQYDLPAASGDEGKAAIVVELVAQKAGEQMLWRVANVRREGGSAPVTTPASQPATAPATTS